MTLDEIDFINAAEIGNLAKVEELARKVNINVTDSTSFHSSALGRAAHSGHFDIVEFLLEKKADVNIKNSDGMTPLHLACSGAFGQSKIVTLLLAHGADIEARANSLDTPLMVAAFHKHKKAIKVLIAAHADVDATDTLTDSALMLACSQENNYEVVRQLLEAGANTFYQNKMGKTVFDNKKMAVASPEYLPLLNNWHKKQEYALTQKLENPQALVMSDITTADGILNFSGRQLLKDNAKFYLFMQKAEVPYPQKRKLFMTIKGRLPAEEKQKIMGALLWAHANETEGKTHDAR